MAAVGLAGHGVPGGVEVVGLERFKIRKDHLRARPCPIPIAWTANAPRRTNAAVREGIAVYCPELSGPTRRMVACMFITSPDEHFILDRHPPVDDAFIAAGFSGHGYKFCSVIGRVMADFRLGDEEKWGVEGVRVGGGEKVVSCRWLDVGRHSTSHLPRGLARISRV